MDKFRIIVAHPGQQHSYRLASALNRYGCLFSYITTVYNKKNGFVVKVLSLFIGKDNKSNRQIIIRSTVKLPQPFASWSNLL